MFFIILSAIALLALIIGICCCGKKYYSYDWPFYTIFVSAIVLVIFAIISVATYYVDNRGYNTFTRQKSYIESHVVESEIENAALTSKKIELNKWLIDAQYDNKYYKLFNFIPDKIQNIELIK